MANYTIGTEAAQSVAETFNAEFGLDPTEESVVASVVSQPETGKFGNALYLRKLKTATTGTMATSYPGAELTPTANTDEKVTVSPTFTYAYIRIPDNTLTRVLHDGAYKAGQRTQLLAAINEARDSGLFALAASLSHTTSAADLDETLFLDAYGQLHKYAKGKMRTFNGDRAATYLFIHPDEIKNVIKIPALREYQIRGSAGSAASGQAATTYGVTIKESGLVYQSAGSTYNVLMLPDAWALAHNIKPTLEDPQRFDLTWKFFAKCEWGAAEWFDSSGVALITS